GVLQHRDRGRPDRRPGGDAAGAGAASPGRARRARRHRRPLGARRPHRMALDDRAWPGAVADRVAPARRGRARDSRPLGGGRVARRRRGALPHQTGRNPLVPETSTQPASLSGGERRSFGTRDWIFFAALLVAVLLVYQPAWNGGFLW